jgi:hypothetical protein
VGRSVISIILSDEGIDKALNDLSKYKEEFIRKVKLFQDKVAKALAKESQIGFNGAILDDLLDYTDVTGQVDVTVDTRGDITVVVANGEDAVWIEFGAGVYHNGSIGTSPHPKGAELGLTIGSYGKGYGKKTTWGYFEDGELRLTHGTPASMPMAKAVTTVCNEMVSIAREVFG